MELVRFLPRHLRELQLQPAQSAFRAALFKPEYGNALALAGPCFTALVEGHPIACGGAQEFHARRAEIWGLIGRDAGPHMRSLTRAARGWFDQCSYSRLELHVATHFGPGHRWARMLGFQEEGPEKLSYSADGRGATPYVRLK